jgi:N-acetylglucosaminyl-diphospho-decaprenol L-rhamnosyltransferase
MAEPERVIVTAAAVLPAGAGEALPAAAVEPLQPVSPRPPLRRVDPRPVALSILIVTWNSARWIERCLQSIPGACGDLPYEVIVYDNASGDETLGRIRDSDALFAARGEKAPLVQLVESSHNDGFAAAINRSMARSRGRYAFLLNPDCELGPGALSSLVEFLEHNPQASAAAPLLADERGDSQREFQLRRFPSLRTLTSEVLLLDKFFPANRAIAHYRYRDLDLTRPQPIEQPAAAALLLRREVFDEIGPLDEQFSPAWFEDVDYCRRLAQAGRSIYVVPSAAARHYGGASLEHISFGDFTDLWYRNMWRYARKWLPSGQAEALRWVIIVGMLLRCVAAIAGFAHPEIGRLGALRAYTAVLKKAFNRWGAR